MLHTPEGAAACSRLAASLLLLKRATLFRQPRSLFNQPHGVQTPPNTAPPQLKARSRAKITGSLSLQSALCLFRDDQRAALVCIFGAPAPVSHPSDRLHVSRVQTITQALMQMRDDSPCTGSGENTHTRVRRWRENADENAPEHLQKYSRCPRARPSS